jgi:hypothetical protein
VGVRASDAAYHKAELVRGCTPLYAGGDMHARLASDGKPVSLDGGDGVCGLGFDKHCLLVKLGIV